MAIDARKLQIVRRNLVAIIAHRAMVGNPEPGVIERRAQPVRRDPGGVASQTSRRETSRLVVRIRGVVVVNRVAISAIGPQRRVVVVHVALCARDAGGVEALQRERRVVVIEGRT